MRKCTGSSMLCFTSLALAACQPGGISDGGGARRYGLLAPGAPLRDRVGAAGGFAASSDARGVPTFVWAASRSPAPVGATREQAVAAVVADRLHAPVAPELFSLEASDGEERRFALARPAAFVLPEGARSRRVLFVDGDRLRNAYLIELYLASGANVDAEAWRY